MLQRLRLPADDDGFSLTEVLVAMVVFAVAASAALALLLSSLQITSSNNSRVQAGNLAAAQIESARSLSALQIPDGLTTTTRSVGGRTFTISQTASYVASGSASSVCTGTGNQLSYKLVSVSVTWPDMAPVKPVESDTLKVVGIGDTGLSPDLGSVAVLVESTGGEPTSGVTVRLMPGNISRTTGADGCAFWTGLAPGNAYSVSTDQTGFVTTLGAQQFNSGSFAVRAAEITRGLDFGYQTAGRLQIALDAPAGFTPVPALPVTVDNEYFTTPVVFSSCATANPQLCVSGDPRTAGALFPGLYGVWAGSCLDAETRGDLDEVQPGAVAATTASLAGVPVRVTALDGTALTGQTVYALHESDERCTSRQAIVLNPGGQSAVQVALPQGNWTFSLDPAGLDAPAGTWPSASLLAGQVSPQVTLISVAP